MFFDHLPPGGFICAHRGARSIAPENTLLAMNKAVECGAHCWETDVRMSRDGELIIFHDSTLERTTDIADREKFQERTPWAVDQFSAAELEQLDAGSWFVTDDPFGTIASGEVNRREQEKIHGQRIPLLHEVLELTRKQKFPVNLEIKDLGTPPGDVGIVDGIMDLLRQTAITELVLLSSFRHEYLVRARALHPTIDLAVLVEEDHPADLVRYLEEVGATAYHPNAVLCNPDLIHKLQGVDIRVTPWTVNDMDQAEALLKSGLGVITDWPQRLI